MTRRKRPAALPAATNRPAAVAPAPTVAVDCSLSAESGRSRLLRNALLAFGLLLLVTAAYQSTWRNRFVWDDNEHITRPELQSLAGLRRI